MYTYKLLRSNRRTIAIYITKDATVEVRAPYGVSHTDIDAFVRLKSPWIDRQLLTAHERNITKTHTKLDYTSRLLYRGKEYPIRISDTGRADFDGKCFLLPEGLDAAQIRRVLVMLYQRLAKPVLEQKVSEHATRMGLFPSNIKISSARTRWGSCSGKNSLNFSWRLILTDDTLIDYVVVHELAHIREHNHSKRFWAVVASVMPDYIIREKVLRAFQIRLENENWFE